MPMPAQQNYQLPSFLQGKTWSNLSQVQGQLPGLFDTSALSQDYENSISSNFDQARALAASAGAAYTRRAQQSGASTLGAGFAQAQAMLPMYAQANAMRADLGAKQLQAKTAQANLSGDLAARIGQLRSARQGMASEWFGNQNRLAQQGQQFNQDLGYRNRALAQNQSQFNSSLSQRQNEFGVTSGQDAARTRLMALQAAMRLPQRASVWRTDAFGRPATDLDQQQANQYQGYKQFDDNLRNQLQSYF